ncbi:uncharacterized protein NEPG_00104 [Nematocida parisii ERTm1]|uniref:uncharacterized protein n=1 Tax=Nematocida parisii (strain ERTm1 / ATCC PRA-289) TaxID=881290 RepID=UPI000264B34F|nr:uncharacterized protein NEPG_00104 [Nematocida parisii ERTm1]EIJ94582.1 hypothetical protein NEPG_00104 [Nematocida parisii ERTm1]|eukprot:XP_013057938.1 hypothetical protein NEPG_00104 [Nematocida parisii ERTm1]
MHIKSICKNIAIIWTSSEFTRNVFASTESGDKNMFKLENSDKYDDSGNKPSTFSQNSKSHNSSKVSDMAKFFESQAMQRSNSNESASNVLYTGTLCRRNRKGFSTKYCLNPNNTASLGKNQANGSIEENQENNMKKGMSGRSRETLTTNQLDPDYNKTKTNQPEATQKDLSTIEANQPEATQKDLLIIEANQPEANQPEASQPEATQKDLSTIEANQPEATQKDLSTIEATQPEANQPEATQPEATQPEATQKDLSTIEATQPEANQPEATQPEATQKDLSTIEANQPEATQPEASQPEATQKDLSTIEATQPEANQPEATQPEAIQKGLLAIEANQPEASQPEATQKDLSTIEATQPEASQPEASQPEATQKDLSLIEANQPEAIPKKPSLEENVKAKKIQREESLKKMKESMITRITRIDSKECSINTAQEGNSICTFSGYKEQPAHNNKGAPTLPSLPKKDPSTNENNLGSTERIKCNEPDENDNNTETTFSSQLKNMVVTIQSNKKKSGHKANKAGTSESKDAFYNELSKKLMRNTQQKDDVSPNSNRRGSKSYEDSSKVFSGPSSLDNTNSIDINTNEFKAALDIRRKRIGESPITSEEEDNQGNDIAIDAIPGAASTLKDEILGHPSKSFSLDENSPKIPTAINPGSFSGQFTPPPPPPPVPTDKNTSKKIKIQIMKIQRLKI